MRSLIFRICIAAGVLMPAFLPALAMAQTPPLTIDADSQYRYAESRLAAGAFDEAIAEFNRFIHFFPDDRRVRMARFEVGRAHFEAGRYADAARVFAALSEAFHDRPLDHTIFFMLSRAHARQGMIEQAMIDLHNLMALSDDPAVIDRARYELGWLYVDQGQWTRADREFDRISPDSRSRLGMDDLQQALARHEDVPLKNPTTAGTLSILPGAGQLYCGRYQDALTAFLINGGLIWAAGESFDNDMVALGSVISVVAFGFYAGNIYGAVNSAHKINRDRMAVFRERLDRYRRPRLSLAPTPSGIRVSLSFAF